MGLLDLVPAGVLHGKDVTTVFNYARDHKFAIPAVNCTSSSTINAALECARAVKSPIIIQLSNGGAAFYCGKSIDNANQKGAILGSIAAAKHVHTVAESYGVPVILHTDHCAKKLVQWVDGLVEVNEQHFKETGKPLFSSHMLDFSEEPHDENIQKCVETLTRLSKVGVTLEMEIGLTGGEEDGVNNENVDSSKLYTQPEHIEKVYKALHAVAPDMFTIAAAFGNVHGVYKPGNVQLRPEVLRDCQAHVYKVCKTPTEKPCFFVFHGGSGSEKEKIAESLNYGVVKMNIDTDTQWGYWSGILQFYNDKKDYLQGQIGNPEGSDKPNKKYYDPRVWIRKAEESFIARLKEAYTDLNCLNKN